MDSYTINLSGDVIDPLALQDALSDLAMQSSGLKGETSLTRKDHIYDESSFHFDAQGYELRGLLQ